MNNYIVYDTNLRFIKDYDLNLFNNINDYSDDNPFTIFVEKIEDRSITYIKKNNRIIQIDSIYNTRDIAKIWAKGIIDKVDYDSKILIYGFGTGIFIRELLALISEDNRIIVYEPDTYIFKDIISFYDVTDIFNDERVNIIFGNLIEQSLRNEYIGLLDYTDLFNLRSECHPNYDYIYEDEYKDYLEKVNVALISVKANRTFLNGEGQYINNNIFTNFTDFVSSKSMEGIHNVVDNEVPAIIVSAGPSLSKNIHHLKQAKGKSVIICVDTAIKALIKEEILPDIIVTVDPHKGTGYLDEVSKNIPLFCQLSSEKDIVGISRADKWFYSTNCQYIDNFLINEKKVKLYSLPAGGTVAHAATSLAVFLGCKIIIFVGQDLAYTNNKTHVENTVRGDLKMKPQDEGVSMCYIDDIYGNKILSNVSFVMYKEWFEDFITFHSEVTFINATEGGAGLRGCEHISLVEAINKFCLVDYDINMQLKSCSELFSTRDKYELYEYIHRIPNEIEKIRHLVVDGINKYNSMLELIYKNKYGSSQFNKLFDSIKEINSKITENDISVFIFDEMQKAITSGFAEIYEKRDDERHELIVLCMKGLDSFKNMLNAMNSLTVLFNETIGC